MPLGLLRPDRTSVRVTSSDLSLATVMKDQFRLSPVLTGTLCRIASVAVIMLATQATFGQDTATKGEAAKGEGTATKPPPANRLTEQGYSLQEGDDPALPLKPVKPLSVDGQVRNDAASWFMSGRLYESRNESKKALAAYRKAIALDPKAIEVYRHLVPLEFKLEEIEAAVRSATKAVEIDPGEYELWQMLAAQAAMTGRLPEAIRCLEQAVRSPRVDKESPESVALNKSLGVLYAATGQIDKAADCYLVLFNALNNPEKFGLDIRAKSKLLSDPQTGYERIGQIFLEAKRIPQASEAFELAGKSGRVGAANLNYNRAKILLLTEKPNEALAELQKYLDGGKTSKGRDAYQLLADILEKLNRSDELIGKLEAMADKDPQNVDLQYYFAERLVAVNELARAEKIYKTAIQNGGDAGGYIGLVQVLRKLHKPEDLLETLSRGLTRVGPDSLARLDAEMKALSEDPALVDDLLAVGRDHANATPSKLTFEKSYVLASVAGKIERTDSAIEFYRHAIKLGRERAFPIYQEMGTLLSKARRFGDAAALYREALAERRPPNQRADLYASLARAQVLGGDAVGAIESIGEALKLEPGDLGHRFEEAWIYGHSRQWAEAITRFERLIAEKDDNKRAQKLFLYNLSNIYVQKGDFKKGEEILEKIMENDPDETQVNNDLGYLWADQGKNLEKAEVMIRKALAVEPDNGAYLDSLGWVLFKLGKPQEALPHLEQALKKNTGGDSTLWDHLGDVQLKLMQTEKAVESYQKALKSAEEDKFSDPQFVQRLRDKLKQHAPQPKQPKPATPGSP